MERPIERLAELKFTTTYNVRTNDGPHSPFFIHFRTPLDMSCGVFVGLMDEPVSQCARFYAADVPGCGPPKCGYCFAIFLCLVSSTLCRVIYNDFLLFEIDHFAWNCVPVCSPLWGSPLWCSPPSITPTYSELCDTWYVKNDGSCQLATFALQRSENVCSILFIIGRQPTNMAVADLLLSLLPLPLFYSKHTPS